jgi:signal transduction histidine kinase/CheY-like chemotaxis protein
MQGKAGFSCFIDKYISKIVYPADRDEMLARLSIRNLYKELKEKKSFTHTYRVERDGAITYFQVKCARVKLEQAVSRFVLGIRNIDGEIRAEMEKNQLLADALEHAQCANRAKTSFLNNMSHDIRTPMNAIIGFTELAQKHIDDPARVADYLGKIEQSSKHLLSLINDVLDMSRIEAGKVQLDEQPDNLSDIIGNLRDIIEADIRSRNLVFTIDTVDVTEEEIFCDRLRLNQVLLNLLSNAMKFTKANGKVSVLLTQYPSAKAGYATYEFRVRDTGIGMSDEFAAHIFEPFTREHTSTVSGIQGTGLGMSITKNFVDMMGGTIAVNSKLGEGTEFIVTLEFKLAAEQPHTLSDKETAHTGESLHGLRILLAEDNELNTEIAVELLTEAGCILETAKNGQEAAEMVENHAPGHYDLVLMDIQMPVMDGYEATRRIRSFREPQLASIPIIAMTANAFEEDRQNALACGMNAHIAKPIDVDKLFDTIQSVQNIKR